MKGQFRKVFSALLVAAALSSNAWAESTGVYVEALGFDDLKIVEPRHGRTLGRDRFELTQEELAGINAMYQAAVSRALNKVEDYHLAETAHEASVSVAADVVRFAPLAPKDDLRSRGTFEKFYSEGAGQGTLEFAIASDDGKVVEAKVTRRAGHNWAINNRFNNRRNVQKMVNAWASEIVQQLQTI